MQLPPGKVVGLLKITNLRKENYSYYLEGQILVQGELIPVGVYLGSRSDEYVLRVRPCPEFETQRVKFEDNIPF